MKRVYCLYRVSNPNQIEKNDIPMQRITCQAYAACRDWEIIREFSEKGISGYKNHMDERDAIIQIKEDALLERFDILLVFMFDRIGRRDDETPFLVEWLVNHGVAVWSVCEGEQRFDNHVDKLTNYIRFWQAAGESERISERTKTRLRQLTEEGHFTGGVCPYGYQLVRMGRENRKKQPVYDLAVNPEEASIVRLIFEKAAYEGYGPYRLAKFMDEMGSHRKNGKPWHPATLYSMLRNPLYTGVLRRGNTQSKQETLRIASDELFEQVQELQMRSERTGARFSTEGGLLTGFLFCGACGSRMMSSHTKRSYKKKDGTVTERRVQRYYCLQRKSGQRCECSGQHIYMAHTVECVLGEMLTKALSAIMVRPPQVLAAEQHSRRLAEVDLQLPLLEQEQHRLSVKIQTLQSEVLECISGKSAFPASQISDMLAQAERERDALQGNIRELTDRKKDISHSVWETEVLMRNHQTLWREYKTAGPERKKIILKHFIQRVTISRGYAMEISFNSKFVDLFDGREICIADPREMRTGNQSV